MKIGDFNYILKENEEVLGLITNEGVHFCSKIKMENIDFLLENINISLSKKFLIMVHKNDK